VNHALGRTSQTKLAEPYHTCCVVDLFVMRYCIRDKTGILQVRGDSVDLTREGFPLLLLLRLLSPPAILLVLYYAANNQSCGIVGDLAAGDAVTQLTRGF